MSGVLFVVYIPSKEVEKRIRNKYETTENVDMETERNCGDGDGAVGLDRTPLTTPEMQQRFCVQPSEVS